MNWDYSLLPAADNVDADRLERRAVRVFNSKAHDSSCLMPQQLFMRKRFFASEI